jgi:hypothetical protein
MEPRQHRIALALMFLAVVSATAAENDGWISLFDGKTLNGWRVAAKPEDVAKNYWSVRDGAITCDSRGRKNHDYVWLLADREFADFDLRLRIRSFRESGGNSGVQVRSRYDMESFYLDGPQIDIHPPTPFRVGLIYDETRGAKHWIFPVLPGSEIQPEQGPRNWKWKHSDEGDGWNDLRVECRGTKIRTTVNGIAIADYDGAGILNDDLHRRRGVGMQGNIALQLHIGDDLYIQFKDLYVKPAQGAR